MTNKEIKHMLKHVEDKPQSEFGKFIFNTNNTAGDLIDFLMWVDNNTVMSGDNTGVDRFMKDADNYIDEPQSYDMLVQKYLQQLNQQS